MVSRPAIFDALGDIQVNNVAVNTHSVCATGTEKLVQNLNETGIGRWNPGGGWELLEMAAQLEAFCRGSAIRRGSPTASILPRIEYAWDSLQLKANEPSVDMGS
jgi:hypothetical protein